MPICYVEGSRSNYPQYAPKPSMRKLPGHGEPTVAHILKAQEIIGKLAGSGKASSRPIGIPVLALRELDSSTNLQVKPLVLVSALFVLPELEKATFMLPKPNQKASGFTQAGEFSAYAANISRVVSNHLTKELVKELPQFGGHEVRVAVGLDLSNQPIMAVDVI
jgi:hypothetical protein